MKRGEAMRRKAWIRVVTTIVALLCTMPVIGGATPPPGETQRVSAFLQPGLAQGTDGIGGFYVKQVGAGVVLGQNDTFVFDPASALKVVLHLLEIYRIQEGVNGDTLNSPTTWYRYPNSPNSTNPTWGDLCPVVVDETPANEEIHSMSDTLAPMMMQSDNRATRAVDLRTGDAHQDQLLGWLGMNSTVLEQIFGCAERNGLENRSTLADVGRVYEAAVNGSLLGDPALIDFFNHMVAFRYAMGSAFETVIREEARDLGFEASDEFVAAYLDNMGVAYKDGKYTYPCAGGSCANTDVTYVQSGLLIVPFRVGFQAVDHRPFVWGSFINRVRVQCATMGCNERVGPVIAAVEKTFVESFRSTIHDSLRTFRNNGQDPAFCPPNGPISGPYGTYTGDLLFALLDDFGRDVSESVFCTLSAIGI